jgi:hypothetical protein
VGVFHVELPEGIFHVGLILFQQSEWAVSNFLPEIQPLPPIMAQVRIMSKEVYTIRPDQHEHEHEQNSGVLSCISGSCLGAVDCWGMLAVVDSSMGECLVERRKSEYQNASHIVISAGLSDESA